MFWIVMLAVGIATFALLSTWTSPGLFVATRAGAQVTPPVRTGENALFDGGQNDDVGTDAAYWFGCVCGSVRFRVRLRTTVN